MLDPNRKDVNEPLSSAKLSLAGKPATWPPPLQHDGAVKQWRAINRSAGDVCVETDKETHKKLQLIEYQKRPNSPLLWTYPMASFLNMKTAAMAVPVPSLFWSRRRDVNLS